MCALAFLLHLMVHTQLSYRSLKNLLLLVWLLLLMGLEDSLVSCESESLLRSYESDRLLHLQNTVCSVCVWLEL